MQIGDGNLVARTLISHDCGEFTELGDLLSVDGNDDITLLQSGFLGSSAFSNLGHINAFHSAQVGFVLILLLLAVDVGLHVLAGNADHGALYGAILLQVVDHFVHDSRRNGKAIASIRAGLGVEHGVDAHELTTSIDQCTARVAAVDGCVGLDK